MPYVNQRWLGGHAHLLAVHNAIKKSLSDGVDEPVASVGLLRENDSSAASAASDMAKGAVGDLGRRHEQRHIAVGEARKLGIPVIAIPLAGRSCCKSQATTTRSAADRVIRFRGRRGAAGRAGLRTDAARPEAEAMGGRVGDAGCCRRQLRQPSTASA